MTELVAMALIAVLASSGYAAGRLHGQIGYRLGYRFGYRQGYFDSDRSSWNRRRREMQAALASVLSTPPAQRPEAFPAWRPVGTTYTSHNDEDDSQGNGGAAPPSAGGGGYGQTVGRHARPDWVLVEANG